MQACPVTDLSWCNPVDRIPNTYPKDQTHAKQPFQKSWFPVEVLTPHHLLRNSNTARVFAWRTHSKPPLDTTPLCSGEGLLDFLQMRVPRFLFPCKSLRSSRRSRERWHGLGSSPPDHALLSLCLPALPEGLTLRLLPLGDIVTSSTILNYYLTFQRCWSSHVSSSDVVGFLSDRSCER